MDGKQTNTALRLVPSATPPSSAYLRRSSGGFRPVRLSCALGRQLACPQPRLGTPTSLVSRPNLSRLSHLAEYWLLFRGRGRQQLDGASYAYGNAAD